MYQQDGLLDVVPRFSFAQKCSEFTVETVVFQTSISIVCRRYFNI